MKKNKGFTILELMVASAILVSVLVSFLYSFNNLVKNADYNQGFSLAFSACRSKLEEMVAHDFSSITVDYGAGGTPGNTFDPVGLTGKGNITITDRQALYGGGWTQATDSANWSARSGHACLAYDNKMWVIGGKDTASFKNDAWSSTDGITWAEATSAAAWPARRNHGSIVYDNKMWVMGGYAGGVIVKNDVWYSTSTDGITWAEATSAAAWPARMNHTALVYNNRMWVLGGIDSVGLKNDIWSSTDGTTWAQATSAAAWQARDQHTSLIYNNKMWVMGGDGGGLGFNDVWYSTSTDGITWAQATSAANWEIRRNHGSIVYDNKMWVMGGFVGGGIYKNDAWSSTDGITWAEATSAAAWPARSSYACLVYNNKMWVLGGYDGGYKNDVWYSGGYNRLLEVVITVCWQQPDGRVFGEDANLNGVLDAGEDINPANGIMDSPAQLRVFLSEKNMPGLGKVFLGRP